MNILVLGGNGFLGSHVCNAFIATGHSVRIFDRNGSKPCIELHPGIELIEGDFNNDRQLELAVSGCDVIVHLISTTLPQSSNDDPVFDVHSNLTGSINLLQTAVRLKVKKVLFASSGGTVYGTPQYTPISEQHPTEPLCSYGIVKLAIEKYLALYEQLHGLKYTVLRISNPYGEGQSYNRRQGAIAVFAHQAIRHENITVWGNGSIIRDYIYIGDVVDAFLKALPYDGSHRIFNIGSGVGCSVNQILDSIEMASRLPINKKYVEGRTFDVPVNLLDIQRATSNLEWMPKVPLSDGIGRTLKWMIEYDSLHK